MKTIYLLLVLLHGNYFVPAQVSCNPILMDGSSFGEIFQVYYKIGNYDKLLEMTSNKTLDTHGKLRIVNYYKNMQFAYSLKLISMTPDGETKYLNYLSIINATPILIRLKVVIENGACKIELPDNFDENRLFLLNAKY